jgi:hypothetical protein
VAERYGAIIIGNGDDGLVVAGHYAASGVPADFKRGKLG